MEDENTIAKLDVALATCQWLCIYQTKNYTCLTWYNVNTEINMPKESLKIEVFGPYIHDFPPAIIIMIEKALTDESNIYQGL